MTPSVYGLTLPHWMLPVMVVGLAGFFLYEAIRGSSAVAHIFGKAGRKIRERATRARRMDARLERMEDQLECATAYLVDDAQYHFEADIIVNENYPHLTRLLPTRIPFTEFKRKWCEGWRPPSYDEASAGY